MFGAMRTRALNGFVIKPVSARSMASTASIRDRFQEAWLESSKGHVKEDVKQPNDKKEYGSGYYQRHHHGLKKGYTHPYHSQKHPLTYGSYTHYLDVTADLVGPEQVSPHYESLSKSRRGLLFLAAYIGSIVSISRLGGWEHNEWIRGMIFHHEYLLALYVGFAEIRHFAWLPGPKFSIFYDVFSRYEFRQLIAHWNDTVEEISTQHFQYTKNQLDYMSIHREYRFIKKRSLVNYLTNERLNLEKHFHDRTLAMLNQISGYEKQNLKNKLSSITQGAFDATLEKIEKDDGTIRQKAFESALDGIRKGKMDFAKDPILPIMKEELESRTKELRGLSAEEESKLLSLTSDQRRAVGQADRTAKDSYLSTVPHLSSAGLKAHKKFNRFVDYLGSINRKD